MLREHPFACRFERTLISGVIDRLVLWSSGNRVVAVEIVDFKTDIIADPSTLDARVATYRPQLNSYRRAVMQIFGIEADQIDAKLLFVESGAIVGV